MQDNHFYILCGMCGVIVHTLMKFQSLAKDAEKANIKLSFKQFVVNDWAGMLLAIVPVFVWLMTFAEAANKYPALRDYIRISFFLVGMVGSYALQQISSKSKEWIREVIDRKTNIADKKEG